MRIGILTALWRRPQLTEIMLRHTATLAIAGVEFVRVAVCSPEDPEPCARVAGWQFVDHANEPLSAKWTAGLLALRMMNVDAVVILGSDDLVNAAFLHRITALLRDHDSDYLQPAGLWVYDVPTGRCIYGEAGRVGAGRVLSRKLLDMIDWQPWGHAEVGRLDQSMDETLDPVVIPYLLKYMPERGEVLVDVKTRADRADDQVWTFDDLAGLTVAKYDGETFLNYHFPSIAASILSLQQEGVNHAPVE